MATSSPITPVIAPPVTPWAEPRPAAGESETGRDRGSVLIMALILTVILGAVAAAITGYTATAVQSSHATDARVHRLAAADGGMQEALTHLFDTGSCPTTVGDRNGAQVEVSGCTVEELVDERELTPFAMVVTAEGLHPSTLAFRRGSAQVGAVEIGGDVFVAQLAEGQASNVHATDAVYRQLADCSVTDGTGPPIPWLGVSSSTCTEQTWGHVSPPPVIPSDPTGTVPNVSGCTVVRPGTLSGTYRGPAYLASGIHRVTGPIQFERNVTVGHPGSATLPAGHPCRAAQDADVNASIGGGPTGAVFVLEGAGRINITGNGTRVTVHGLHADGRTPALVAFPDPTGGFGASTQDPNNHPVLHLGHPNAAFSFLGEVWAPRGWVELSQMSSSGAQGAAFQGGLTVARFSVRTSASVSGLIISLEPGARTYVHRIEVSAQLRGGVTTISAIARQRADDPMSLESWRVH